MKRRIISIVLFGFFLPVMCFSQANEFNKTKISRIYEEADKLFKSGNYSASLEYLKRESGNLLSSSDSLIYLKIKNLENLYRLDNIYAKEMETSLQVFFSRINKYSFPELKYTEVTAYYTVFQSFKEKDKSFYDSIVLVTDLNKSSSLPGIKAITIDYLKAYPNSYYSKELNTYISNINNRLLQLEHTRMKREKDSTNREKLKLVGKLLSMNLSYSVPSGGKGRFPGFQNYNEVFNFYSGNYTGSMGEKYSVGASLGEAFFNFYTGPRVKIGINWNVLDAEYTVFDWSANSVMYDKEGSTKLLKELKTIKAGTRIAPVAVVFISKSTSVAIYYGFRPGIQFIMHGSYFSFSNGAGTSAYQVKPIISNYNLSNEAGMKIYFFKKLFLSPYIHFGNYTWKNSITDVSTGSGGTIQKVQANNKFNYWGIRIGF